MDSTMHRALVDAGYAPLPDYIARGGMQTDSSDDRVIEVVAKYAGVDASTIKATHHLAVDLNIDSLTRSAIVVTLESRFCIAIHEIQQQAVETVADLAALVAALVHQKGSIQ